MKLDFMFYWSSIVLGVGLAMDACSVSMANGMAEPKMKRKKGFLIAGIFGTFQGFMPLIGWLCVHTFIQYFKAFQKFIPYIALVLLLFVGGKMIYECIKCKEEECGSKAGMGALLVQGVATSIDALSVGFTIADYDAKGAIISSLIIAVSTFAICCAGVEIGKTFGTKLANKAQIFGGAILIFIGLEIFLSGIGII